MAFTLPALRWRYATTAKNRMFLRVVLIMALLLIALFMPGLPEERLHFLTYGLLGWLICWSVEAMEENENSLWSRTGWLLPCLLVWLAGGIDELIQWWLPVRVFDVRDIIFNGVAGMLGIATFATGSLKSAPSTPSPPLP
ncbi:MAG: VanZ family protein [Thermodesulfobacteriota bacterium]|nr:VanZ family protein [Thermodesulfobacteriota bacterium]